jgi:hypothetical protein
VDAAENLIEAVILPPHLARGGASWHDIIGVKSGEYGPGDTPGVAAVFAYQDGKSLPGRTRIGRLYLPPGKRPNSHALPPALPAAAYLGIPAGAELIKALMRRILPAISAKAAEPLGSVVRKNLAAAGEVRHGRPIPERCEQTLPAVERRPAVTPGTLLHRGETNSVKNVAEGERHGGSDDHRVLLRGADITASSMPAGCVRTA